VYQGEMLWGTSQTFRAMFVGERCHIYHGQLVLKISQV
jgi:hypothetical protein